MDFASEARIEISTACNHKCMFCTHHTTFSRKKEIMSNDLFAHIISEVEKQPDIKNITLSGFGEAALDKHLIWKMKYVKEKGYNVNILSNGSALSKESIDDMFDLGVSNLRVSVHSIDRFNFKKIAGIGDLLYEKLFENINYISSKRNNKTLFIINSVIDPSMPQHDINDLVEYFENRADVVEIWKPHNWSNELNYRNGDFVKKTCGRPFRGPLQVQVDGTINMCCFDYDGKTILGDLNKNSIDEIFTNSKMYKKLLKHHTSGDFRNSGLICETCDQRISYDGLIYSSQKATKEEREKMFSSTYVKM